MTELFEKKRVSRPYHPTNCLKDRVRQGLFLCDGQKCLEFINVSEGM